jgi:SAM-dependent methyltransferase
MNDTDDGFSKDYFDAAYRITPPWEIGQPQPALLALLDEYPPTGPVLEVGCGTGALSIAIAEQGLVVLGVDVAEAAIAQARARVESAAPSVKNLVSFATGDALAPSQWPGPFGAIVDCGFMHLFGQTERDRFAGELARALIDGGRYYLLGFAFDLPVPQSPRAVRENEISERFTLGAGWRVLALRPAVFRLRGAHVEVPALAACVERVTRARDQSQTH